MLSLVTGATGFLGSRLAHKLRERGERVRVLVRETSDRRRIADLDLESVTGDITDPDAVGRAVHGVDRVFHVAALYELGTRDPDRMARVNVGGAENVLSAAHAAGVPALHVSSVVALGPTGRAPADETHWEKTPPRSAYEATKRRAHELARALVAEGARVRIALPVTIYGPDDPSLVGQLHKWVARGALRVGALADVTMSLVHVDDCADGLVALMERGREGGEYILCERSLTFREWFTMAARAAGKRPPLAYLPDWALRTFSTGAARAAPLAGFPSELVREGLAMSLGVDWSFSGDKARRELGWTPRPLEEGLASTLFWYQNGYPRNRPARPTPSPERRP